MDRGPMMLTGDVSLPKDDKTTMLGEQIIAGQLTGLKTHRNANNVQESERLNRMGSTPRQVDRLFISIYLIIIHLEISIQNISLVLSCELQLMS